MNIQPGLWNYDCQDIQKSRPGMHLFYEGEPFLYAIGNTYGFNLLKDLDIGAIISDKSYTITTETSTIRTTSQNTI
ncbi:hypothetical protein RhiirA5_441807 [Rhizophagus irregularis]|uniref:Uncharacterized protein n=1 Tax=Rhizophagus irregularis TaxID=588596 RepID=A0A2N0NFC3_9GLOM|nr:hypothetical protein RhiirA5_441807 [Rhizophagus irregularis]